MDKLLSEKGWFSVKSESLVRELQHNLDQAWKVFVPQVYDSLLIWQRTCLKICGEAHLPEQDRPCSMKLLCRRIWLTMLSWAGKARWWQLTSVQHLHRSLAFTRSSSDVDNTAQLYLVNKDIDETELNGQEPLAQSSWFSFQGHYR